MVSVNLLLKSEAITRRFAAYSCGAAIGWINLGKDIPHILTSSSQE
jgi:hypothetical protein